MARPKKDQTPEETLESPTERAIAPETATPEPQGYTPPAYVPPAPRQMRVSRQDAQGEPMSRRFPDIRGGICEYCGVLDPKVPSQFQYKLCPHYRGQQAWCAYCPAHKDPDEVAYHETLVVHEDPFNPGNLIMICGNYDCSKKHREKFGIAT